jgi:calpain-7
VLTGWLPQKYNLSRPDVDIEKLWRKVLRGYKTNDCLITIGTGVITDEDNVGLIGNHAYGVLEIIEVENKRFFLVKNPWGHFRWQGKYSYGDSNWTPSLKAALGYDNFDEDKGVFWIEFASVMEFFDSLDINWNPDLLVYNKSFFDHWKAADMVNSNTFSIKDNPQYYINYMANESELATIGPNFISWVVISKLLITHPDGSHEDEEDSKDYLAMHCYPNNGKAKVLEDRNCVKKSKYSSTQTIMLYLDLPSQTYLHPQKVLNLVLDQLDRKKDLYFNVRVFSNVAFEVGRAGLNYKFRQEILVPNTMGGGTANAPFFYKNPQFFIGADR